MMAHFRNQTLARARHKNSWRGWKQKQWSSSKKSIREHNINAILNIDFLHNHNTQSLYHMISSFQKRMNLLITANRWLTNMTSDLSKWHTRSYTATVTSIALKVVCWTPLYHQFFGDDGWLISPVTVRHKKLMEGHEGVENKSHAHHPGKSVKEQNINAILYTDSFHNIKIINVPYILFKFFKREKTCFTTKMQPTNMTNDSSNWQNKIF